MCYVGNCAGRGTFNPADSLCTCDVGYGGDDCSINLLELSSVGASRRKLESAQPYASEQGWHAPQPAAEELLGMAANPAAATMPAVPFSLRNMLMYADTLVNSKTDAAAAAGAGRHLLESGDAFGGQTVGCGFYDLFYEGCGTSSQCFYDSLGCSADAPFYDFYTGTMLRHAPDVEYFDDFLLGSVFGDRGFLGKSSALWSSVTPAVTDAGDDYNGGLAGSTPLTLQLAGLPAAPHEVIMSFDFVVDGGVGEFSRSPVALMVLGEGSVEANAVLDVTPAGSAQSIHQVEFKFTYSGANLKLRIAAAAPLAAGARWGVDKVMISSMVTNYPPVAEDKQVHISPDPLIGGVNTIELRGFDQECEGLEYHITSLPTEGKLFHCACDSLWTTPITPADLPAMVPGPCHRLVYEPAANEPKTDLAGSPFDAFQYRVKDGYGEYSSPAYVKVFIDTPDTEDTPVAGAPGLAIACDGADDVVSVSWALGELLEEFTLEMRFKVTGDGAGTLLHKAGSYWLGWTEYGALGAWVTTASGATLRVEAMRGYTDRLWHHVAVTYDSAMLGLAVDGDLVASAEGVAPSPAAPSPFVYATLCAALMPGTGTVASATAFNGHVDDVRFWDIALGMNKVEELWVAGHIAEPNVEEGLRAYFDFNLGGNVPVSSAVFDRTSGHVDAFFSTLSPDGVSAGLDAMFPAYVSSTAVYSGGVSTMEDTPVLVHLHGGDLEGGVTFWVATMPLKGDLVDTVTGRTILTSPAPITGSSVLYHPKGSACGRDVFKYQAFDGEEFSYKAGVLIDIEPVNDPPTCAALTTEMTAAGGPVLVQLVGADEDQDAFLRYVITRPPRRGHLFQSDLAGNKLELIDASMTSIGSTSAFVLYQPRDIGTDASEGYPYDSFAYSVYDRQSNSSECVVDVSIPDDGCDPKPVSGDPGYALRFDGSDDFVTLGSLSMLLPGWPMVPAMSLGLWFRTSYVTSEGMLTLAQIGPISLHISKVYGLGLGLGERVTPTFEHFNEGAWHRVVVTFDGAKAHLYVDGALRASLLDLELPSTYDDALVLGYWTAGEGGTGRTGHYNGQIDEVSLWASVVDAIGEDVRFAPDFAGYAANAPLYPASVAAHWAFNEAQGVSLYNAATGAWVEGLGGAGQAETQPRWVASTVPVGDVYNATEGELELLALRCSSEYTDTVDVVLLTLPGDTGVGGGRLWYTDDGVTPLYPIDSVPHVLKGGKVIYESGPLGRNAPFQLNYGDFGYVCIGDLFRTLTDHLSNFDFYGLSAMRRSGSFLDAVSDIIQNLPTPPPLPVPPLPEPLPPVAPILVQSTLSTSFFYGLNLFPLPPTDNDTLVFPPSPIPVEPPAVEELANVVLQDLIAQFFPPGTIGPNGARGQTKISSITLRVVILELTPEAFVSPGNEALLGDLIALVGAAAGVDPVAQVAVASVEQQPNGPARRQIDTAPASPTGTVAVELVVSFSANQQAGAIAFEALVTSNADALFAGIATSSGLPFRQTWGIAAVTAVSTQAAFVAVGPNVVPSCFQVSAVTPVTVNVMHVNHAPTACGPTGECRLSVAYGAHSDLTYEIEAMDMDQQDELDVTITYLASKGTLLAPYGAVDTAPAESPVRGDLYSLYLSREGARVARDPVTGRFPLVYSPRVNGAGADFDAFGFVVSDGTVLSQEYTVHVDVADNALLAPMPAAGTNGYALAFDGYDDYASLGPVAAYGLRKAATFALWIKTGSSGAEHGVTVLSAGPYRLYWSKLGGLTFARGPASVAAGVTLNDAAWHHVAAAYDGNFVMLYVDGMPMGATRAADEDDDAWWTTEVTLGAWAHYGAAPSEFFNGQLDEVAVFSAASAELMTGIAARRRCGASHLSCFEGDEEGILGYWRLNEALGSHLASAVPTPATVPLEAMRLGDADGTAEAMPERVASTVPLLNTVELLEDTEVTFALPGVSFDAEDPDVVISFLPTTGRLYAGGARLAAGDAFSMSSPVTFVPKANAAGSEAFGYVVHDGTMASDVQLVQLVVHPQNDVPEAADMTLAVDFKDPAPVEIRLKTRDVDEGDAPIWLITVLPTHGSLYVTSPAFVDGDFESPSRNLSGLVITPNTVVPSRVWYVPMLNDGDLIDSFSYVVEDAATVAQQELLLEAEVTRESVGDEYATALRPFGAAAARRLRSRMATVTLDGSAVGLPAQDTPVVGIAGLALHFDGCQTLARLGAASAYGLMAPTADAPATLSVWFKTSAVGTEDGMSLLVAGPYALAWSKVLGLQFSVGPSTLPSYSAWNDGAWHHVAASYDGARMSLSVDGGAPMVMAAPWDASSADGPVTLGADASLASYYNGFLDELVVGSSAAGLFHFNEAAGDALLNVGTGPAGTLGDGGVAASQPARVASSAPLSLGAITLEEDSEAAVLLVAHNTDAAASGVNFVITELPERGMLYTTSAATGAKGVLIKPAHLPKVLASGVDTVIFVPEPNAWSGPDVPYARFAYAADIAGTAVTAARSASMTCTLHVLPVNDTPQLAQRFHTLSLAENAVGELSLVAAASSDIETPSENLVTMVTFLPAIGLLYQWDDTLISERNTAVTDAALRLKYVPPPNLAGAPLTAFGFVVSDGELLSEGGVVSIAVAGNSAVDLSAGGSVFVASGAGDMPPPQLDGAFTVDAWVHVPPGGLAASVWSVVSTAYASLPSSAAAFTSQRWPAPLSYVNTPPAFEEGRWHHLAWVSKLDGPSHTAALLYVDGGLVALQAVASEGAMANPADPSVLLVGAPSASDGPAAFLGKVDEVKVYRRGLTQAEVIASMNARTSSLLSSATGNEAVGKGLELVYCLHADLAADLVGHWTFDTATPAGLTPNEADPATPGALTGGAMLRKVHAPMAPTSDAARAAAPGLRASAGSGFALMMDGDDDGASVALDPGAVDPAGGGAMEFWFKSGAVRPFMALAALGGLSAHWTPVGGFGLHIASGSLHTHASFGDGAWHHVRAAAAFVPSARNFPEAGPGQWNLTLSVDGAMYGPMLVAADGPLLAGTAPALLLGASAEARWASMGGQRFCGTLDFASATSADGTMPMAMPAFDGPLSRAGMMRDLSGSPALAGMWTLAGSPTWVFSSAPRAVPTYTVREDSGLAPIALLAGDAEGDQLKFYVTAAPEHGALLVEDADGQLVDVAVCHAGGDAGDDEAACTPIPAPVDGSPPVVHYRPGGDMYGTVLLQYVADDGYARSDPAYIVIDVEPVNDLPRLATLRLAVALPADGARASITLGGGEDIEGEPLAYVVSTLPAKGRLYQADGMPIMAPGTPVADAGQRLLYAPGANPSGAAYDSFGFQATDGNVGACVGAPPLPCPPAGDAQPYFTAEGTVTLSATGAAGGNTLPVAGHAGYALQFDGVDDMVVVGLDDSVGGPVSLELWLKSSSAVNEFATIATLVAPGAEPDYLSLHLTRFGAVGVDAAVGGEVAAAYSHAVVNDGNWHHVAASFDGARLALVVDGTSCEVCEVEHPAGVEAMPAFASLSLGPASSAAYSLLFAGLLDDVRLWSAARPLEAVAADMHTLLHGDEADLRLWFPLDGQSTLDGVVPDDGAADGMSEDGEARGGIAWVPSSAPLTTHKYDVLEDSRTPVELYGTDADFDPLAFYVMGLPAHGQLFTSADLTAAPIAATPFLLPGSTVWYQPPPHVFGGPAFDAFGYGVHDGMAFGKSEARVLINTVAPTPDAPHLHAMPSSLSVATGGRLHITVSATDADLLDLGASGDLVELRVSSLPATGALYQLAADGSSPGERITAPGTALTATSVDGIVLTGHLLFVPDQDLGSGAATAGGRDAYQISFGMQAADLNSGAAYGGRESMLVVTVTPALASTAPLDVTAPLGLGAAGFRGGLTGQAILLDGESGYVIGGNATDGAALAGADGSFTLELFFKSTSAMQEKTVLAAKEGAFSLGWRRYFGLSVAATTDDGSLLLVGSRKRYNDGAWHHVALAWSAPAATLSLYVDGALAESATAPEAGERLPLADSGPLLLGTDGSGAQAALFAGFLDEVRAWADALDAVAVADTYRGMPNGDEPAPLALHYSFNLAPETTPSGVVVDASGAGRDGIYVDSAGGPPVTLTSSTPVYMKAVIVEQDTPKLVRLAGGDVDLDGVDFRVTTLPEHGHLLVGGEPIMYVPFRLPARELTFTPGAGASANTSFTFMVSDGKLLSGVATVVLTLAGSPDGPVASPVPTVSAFTDVCGALVGNNRAEAPEAGGAPASWWAEACAAGEAAMYRVDLAGADADGDAIIFHVTTLPQLGRLYQAHEADASRPDLAAPITAPGMMVRTDDADATTATLWYSLADVDYASAPQEVFFGYAVAEASGSGLTSSEQRVAVALSQAPGAPAIYSGVKGYAIYFDGADAAVEAPVEAAGPVGDFSLETWFKSSGALLDGATLLSGPSFRLGWTSHAGLGMHFFGVAADLSAGMALNDGEWHHVAVSVARAGRTSLYVDGIEAAGQPTPGLDLEDIPALTIGRSAMPASGRVRSQFRGQMDEVRLWIRALSAAEVATRMNLLLSGDEPGLATYLRFNRGDIISNLSVRDLAGAANSSAAVTGAPALVSSSAPLTMLATLPENGRLELALTGSDAATGAMLRAVVTGLPPAGRLLHADSLAPITAVPAVLSDPLNRVVFEPVPHTYGNPAAAVPFLYGALKFVTSYSDPATGVTSRSDEDTVVLAVTPVNYAPRLPTPMATYPRMDYADVAVPLEATDSDSDTLTFVITTLPTHGTLFTTPDGVTRGERITAPGTALAEGAAMVLYSPILVDAPTGGQYATYFGYTARDAPGQFAVEPEARVMFEVAPGAVMPPIAGDTTTALLFSGFGEPAQLTLATALAGTPLAGPRGLTVEAWMKSSAGLARVGDATLVECEAFSLRVGRVHGLSFHVFAAEGGAEPAASASQELPSVGSADTDINDGAWHFVAATFETGVSGRPGATRLRVYVDGELAGESDVVVPGGVLSLASAEGTLSVGRHFAGLIDEVRVWGRALTLESWAASARYTWDATGLAALSGAEAGLLGYWRLNEDPAAEVLYDAAAHLASAAARLGGGVKVPSAAPFGNALRVGEDRSAVYCLQGDAPRKVLTLMPANGALYQTGPDGRSPVGAPIMGAPALVANSAGCLVYTPEPDFYGADALAFLVETAEGGMMSAEVTVAITVVPVNDAPEILSFTRAVTTLRNRPATISILGADVDHPDTVAVTITTLPYEGALYHGSRRINRTPTRLAPSVELTYVPIPNAHGGAAGDPISADEFSFAITDPEGASSAMITVPITVLRQQALALEFRSPMELPAELENELPPTFTLTAYVKAEPLPTAFRRRLATYQVEGVNQGAGYVDFSTTGTDFDNMAAAAYVMGTVMQAPPQDVQDGQWHHVAAIFDGVLKSVYVDGRLDTSQAVAAAAAATDAVRAAKLGTSALMSEFLATYVGAAGGNVTVGGASEELTTGPASASVATALVDEVRLYGRALSVKELRAATLTPNAAPAGLLSTIAFDAGIGEAYLDLNAPVAGEAGYALSPSPGRVVVISDDANSGDRGSAFGMDPNKALTVSVWFKSARGCASLGALVAKGAVLGTYGAHRDSNVGGQWALQFTAAGGLGFHIMERRDLLISANSYKTYCDGAWHMATGIYDGANSVLYVDGVHQATTSMDGQFVTQRSLDLNANLVVGGDAEAARVSNDGVFATSVFHGQLDELRVWDYERSSNELLQDLSMKVPVNTTDPGLRAWYRFNDPAARADVLPDDAVTATQQQLSSPPRQGLITGTDPTTAWTASQLPVQKAFDILGFNTPLKLRLYYVDKDGDRVEPVLTTLPERGTVWVSDESGALLKQVHREGIVLTRDNTPDSTPAYADYLVYIPGDPVEDIPVPYAQLGYAASDGRELGPEELFTFNVFAVNEAPVANPLTVLVLEDTPTAFTLNVFDPEGQDVSVLIISGPTRGALTNDAGQPVSRVLPNENGEIVIVYVPAPNDVSTQTFNYVAVDSEGERSMEATVTLIIQCVNDAPLVELARDTQETYRGQRATLLLGITVSDIDSAEHPGFSITVSVPSGGLSDVSAADAQSAGAQQLVLTGELSDLNARLGRLYYYNAEDAASVPVTVTANDGHSECDNGPQSASAVLTIVVIDSPFDNVAFTDDGRAIRMVYTCEVDTTPFEGSEDCSLILREDTLRTLGAFDTCYASGSLQVNPLSKVPCPRCAFGSDRRTYTITLGPGATIVPGSRLNAKGSVVTSTAAPAGLGCPLGNLLPGDLHPPYALPVNPPLNPAIPTVEVDGPHRVGSCNPVRASGLSVTNALGRALTYTWTLSGPEQPSAELRSLVAASRGPMLTLPPELPFGTWTISLRVTNWLRATSTSAATLVVEKVNRPIPTIYIQGPDTFFTRRNLRTTITAVVEATLCPDFCTDAAALTYSWAQTREPFGGVSVVPSRVTSTGVVLSIPAGVLAPTFRAQFYEFEVRAEDCVDPSVIGDAAALVDVRPQPLVAAIAGGDREWYNNQELLLDGTYSSDPDAAQLPAPGLPPAHLVFSWAAFDTDGVELTALTAALGDGPEARLPGGAVENAQDVTFVLTLSSNRVGDGDTRVDVTSATIAFITNPAPQAFIDPVIAWKLNPSTYNAFSGGGVPLLGGQLTYEWSLAPLAAGPGCARQPECELTTQQPDLTDPAVAPGGPNGAALFLMPNTLAPGRLQLTLTVCELRDNAPPLCAEARAAAVVNSPPATGLVSVHPTGDTSCEGTEFIVLAHAFDDVDTPVSYDFGFFDASGMYFSLTPATRSTGAVVLLPAIGTEIGVRATDGLLAETVAAAPGEVLSAALCGAPASPEDSVAEVVALLQDQLRIALGTNNDDLAMQLLINMAGALASDPPGTPSDPAALTERQQLRGQLVETVAGLLTDGYYDPEKALQALAVLMAVPAEVDATTRATTAAALAAISSNSLAARRALSLDTGSMAVHLLSILLEASAADGVITKAESDQVFALASDIGQATLGYSDIPTRVPLTLPMGEPPAIPPGADSFRLALNSAAESDLVRDLEVGAFLLRQDTVAGLVTASSRRRAMLADLSSEGAMNRVTLVSPDFNGNVPPPVNVYDYIADEDGEPITAIVGLRAFNMPDCPAAVAKYDSVGSGNRLHCDTWMAAQPEAAMGVTLFLDPLPDSGETIKLSLTEHSPGSYDPAVLEPGCKAVLLGDLEWTSDMVSTEADDAGIVCSTRTFGDFAAFAVPVEEAVPPPSPTLEPVGTEQPPEPPAPTAPPPPPADGLNIALIVGPIIAVVALIVLLVALLLCRRRKQAGRVQQIAPGDAGSEPTYGGGSAPTGTEAAAQPLIGSDAMQPDGPRSSAALN